MKCICKKNIETYHKGLQHADKEIRDILFEAIVKALPKAEYKIWHAHPVWFLDGNPIVGYSKLKNLVRLLFCSGADFGDDKLTQGNGKFKDAFVSYTNALQINEKNLKRWLMLAQKIQWDYKNIVTKKGVLERLL